MANRRFLVAALLVGAAFPVTSAGSACAAGSDRAALVVDTGAAAYSYCVALPDDSVSGLELIQLAHDQHGLQYRFGHGGQAVCMLAGVGAEGDDCFGEYPDFWGYWHGDGDGGWQWSSAGAGSSLVEDGDVQGWSWGRGQDGSTHPPPPPTRADEVCKPPASPPREPRPRPDNSASQRRPEAPAPPATDRADQAPAGAGPRNERRVEEPPQETPAAKQRLSPRTATEPAAPPAAPPTPAATTPPERPPGPPPTAVAALALSAALGTGGALALRRRRR